MDEQGVRQLMLQVVDEQSKGHNASLEMSTVLGEVVSRLRDGKLQVSEKIILTVWYDLFRTGILSWGSNLANPKLPWCHVTAQGEAALAQLSRDPSNPEGYLAFLKTSARINDVAMSYVQEALKTYNSVCHKATAVMIGCAAESLVLEIRDVLVAKLKEKGHTPDKKLQDWRIKTVLDSLMAELEKRQQDMPRQLQEEFSAYWSAFTGQLRMARNDAGHPTSIDPVTTDSVHAGLLIFPALAKLAGQLVEWIQGGM